MAKRTYIFLALIFALTLASRLYIEYSLQNFEYDAYFNLRQAQDIMANGVPSYNDPYSYEGRFFTFLPFFHYVLALFGKIIGLETAARIVPNVLASLLAIVVFLICRDITKSDGAALFSAFISGFVPVFFSETISTISVMSAVVPVMFFLMYCFMNIKNGQRYVIMYIIFFFVLVLMHPASLLFVLALYFYLLLCKLEHIKITKAEVELPIFSTFLWLWLNLMIYKRAFLIHGTAVIWQNLPVMLFRESFVGINIIESLLKIGLMPFLFGLYIIYKGFFGEKSKSSYLFVAFALSTALMLWLKLVSLTVGFVLLGVVLAILFSSFYVRLGDYIMGTKLAQFWPYMVVGLVAVFVITSVLPSFSDAISRDDIPRQSEIEAMLWLRENTPAGSVVLASPEEGHLITYYAQRKNVADTNFLLISNLDQRLGDIREIYTTRFKTRAIDLLNKYNVDYIYVSDTTRKSLSFEHLLYSDQSCLARVYDSHDIQIYHSLCVLGEPS
jgi:hypothetical protein